MAPQFSPKLMDLDTTHGIYAYIGEAMAGVIDGTWRNARLEADVAGGSVGLSGQVERHDGRLEGLDVHRLDFRVSKAVRNLHRIMAREDGKDWNRVDFELAESGEFSLRFGRDDALAQDLARFERAE